MRRADRLFQIVQHLRGGRLLTAANLSERLEVSTRTIYRDVADLIGSGVPIEGEAGIGYLMRQGYDLPPLMFTIDELEALMLGARMVAARADADTARAAQNAVAKIVAVVPKDTRPWLLNAPLYAPNSAPRREDLVDLSPLRLALRGERKIRIRYIDGQHHSTERVLWPLSMAFFEGGRAIVAWCELRDDYRHFRTDRIQQLEVLTARYPKRRTVLPEGWWQQEQQRLAASAS